MSHVLDGEEGSVTVTAGAIQQIVLTAAEAVDGARVRRPRRHLDIAVADGRVRVELELAIRYGVVVSDAARDVQTRVTDALRTMCGLDVTAVDVAVEELE